MFTSSWPGLSRASMSSRWLHSKTWMAGTSPAMTDEGSSKINQADPVGHQRGLRLALDFHGHVGARQQFGRLAQRGVYKCKAAANARAGAHRGDEAQFVEAVIDSHGGARDDWHHLV